MIYLDNAATTFPKHTSVYEKMDNTNRNLAVNAGRGSYKAARAANEIIDETKQQLRELVKADYAASVVFTPSITIALNQIIYGLEINSHDVVYASLYEHNAVARSLHELSKQTGCKIKHLPVNSSTLEIDIEKLKYDFSVDPPTAVFCTHMSNVTGYVLPIDKVFEEAKKYAAITVVDTAQSLGVIDFDVKKTEADIIAFAGHKSLYGPFGVGGFINCSNIILKTVVTGGTGSDSLNLDMPTGPESHYEAASKNIVAIAGLNAALKCLNVSEIYKHERMLTDYLIEKMKDVDGVHIMIPPTRDNHIGIVSFTLEGYMSSDVGMILDEDFDIAVRTGYHCSPWIHKYLNDSAYQGTIRIGLGQFNTKGDIDLLISALKEI